MAVWGDPLWDVASHMHRAAYPPGQARDVLDLLLGTCPELDGSAGEERAYQGYLRIERYRSLVLDCARNLRLGREWDEETRAREAAVYHRKLVAAEVGQLGREEVLDLFTRFWERRGS